MLLPLAANHQQYGSLGSVLVIAVAKWQGMGAIALASKRLGLQ
ncbi:MAG: hypothetical protein SAJ12_07890 [Jaaginema sp. PMC 1079.18]|nr:hypothetical protein [Jaaginema sp. PMC 1080.18]MEC4850919.1 hypothetical protein [Jaaginema sp. PMC 1079.18]